MKRILTFIPALGLTAASFIGYAGSQWWIFDLFAHFRPQYIVFGALFILGYIWHRFWHTFEERLAFFLIIAITFLNTALVFKFFFPVHHPSNDTEFTILFSNIYIHNTTHLKLVPFIEKTDPDVVALAEVTENSFTDFQKALSHTHPYSHFQKKYRYFGVAIFSKTPPANQDIVHYFSEEALPSLQLDLIKNSEAVRVIVTHPYPPASEWMTAHRNKQLLGLADAVGQTNMPVVVVGDYNLTPWSWLFEEVTKRGKLHTSQQGFGPQPSWPMWAPPFARIPIDHALVNEKVTVTNRFRGPNIGSDHRPIVVQVKVNE